MAIRDRFRRALQRSDDSSSSTSSTTSTASSSQNDITITKTPTAATGTTTASDTSNFSSSSRRKHPSRIFSWRSSSSSSSSEKKAKKGKPIHPRDKPLTAINIQHQQMLGQFTWTFGSSPERMSQLCLPEEFDGVSPCCTRPPSIIDSDCISPGLSRLNITEHES